MMEVEIVKCLHSHDGISRGYNKIEAEQTDFEKNKYYLCIKSAVYNIPYVYKQQQICSRREHDWMDKKFGNPVLFESVQFLKFANKKELKVFKRKYFENNDMLLELVEV